MTHKLNNTNLVVVRKKCFSLVVGYDWLWLTKVHFACTFSFEMHNNQNKWSYLQLQIGMCWNLVRHVIKNAHNLEIHWITTIVVAKLVDLNYCCSNSHKHRVRANKVFYHESSKPMNLICKWKPFKKLTSTTCNIIKISWQLK